MLRIVLFCVGRIVSAWSVWYARPLLFFNCTLCPTARMAATNEHMVVSLVFFRTFEPISLTPYSCMQKKGVPMVYERAAAQVPILYVCPVENVLGRASDSMLSGRQYELHVAQIQIPNSKGGSC